MDAKATAVTVKEYPMTEKRAGQKADSAKILKFQKEDGMTETVEVNQSLAYRFIKRFFDIVISLIGLIVLSPILIITIIAIRIEDHGPAFFTQNRIGKDKAVFKMYKFRSMKMNAAEIHEQMKKDYGCDDIRKKNKKDPRVTKVGNFIRKTNIDELPQLINILIGNMSFVGPRPLPDYEFNDEQETFKGRYDARYAVPQGLTCIWQISNRSEPSFADRMQMDVDYSLKCGIGEDLKLFFQTFIYALVGKAAY